MPKLSPELQAKINNSLCMRLHGVVRLNGRRGLSMFVMKGPTYNEQFIDIHSYEFQLDQHYFHVRRKVDHELS